MSESRASSTTRMSHVTHATQKLCARLALQKNITLSILIPHLLISLFIFSFPPTTTRPHYYSCSQQPSFLPTTKHSLSHHKTISLSLSPSQQSSLSLHLRFSHQLLPTTTTYHHRHTLSTLRCILHTFSLSI